MPSTFNKSLAGTITPAAPVVRKPERTWAGTVTPAGQVAEFVQPVMTPGFVPIAG